MGASAPSRVWYSGIDVDLLTPSSRQAFTSALGAATQMLENADTPTSEIEVETTLGSNGRMRGAEINEGPEALRQLAAFMLTTVELKEDRRPTSEWSGTFRIGYRAAD